MVWTTPKTWASGYVVLAGDLNTHLRDNLNVTAPAVMTTAGDIIYASGANTPARLAKSTTSTQYLANTGTSNIPAWNEVALATGVSGVLPIANGGVGVALSDPDADRILFWDDSAGAYAYLTAGTNLTITATTIAASGLAALVDDTSPQVGGSAGLDLQAQLLVGNGGTTGIAISANGEVTMAAQPSFLAYNSVIDYNVTGDNSTYTLIYDTEVFDQNADFDGTSTFTAPVTGRYLVSVSTHLDGVTASETLCIIIMISSNRNYSDSYGDVGAQVDAQDEISYGTTTLVDMDAGDTLTVTIRASGGTKVIDITGDVQMQTRLSADLLA